MIARGLVLAAIAVCVALLLVVGGVSLWFIGAAFYAVVSLILS